MSYYEYDGRRGFMSNVPTAVKNLIIKSIATIVRIKTDEGYE